MKTSFRLQAAYLSIIAALGLDSACAARSGDDVGEDGASQDSSDSGDSTVRGSKREPGLARWLT